MKTKLLAVMMMWMAAFWSIIGVASAQTDTWADTTKGLKGNTWVWQIAWVWENDRKWSKLLDVIKNWVNWVLGMLALITLCIVLWWGFQMVTAAGDDGKYKKGFTILKQAGVWLIIILLAWIIVSVVFWLVGSVGWADAANETTQTTSK